MKKWGHYSCFHISFLIYGPLIVENCVLYANFLWYQQNSKTVWAIYEYTSENSCFTLLKNGVGYYAMIYSLEDISVWSWWILLNFCWVSTFLDIWFFNISWTVNISNPYKNTFMKELDEVLDRNKLL